MKNLIFACTLALLASTASAFASEMVTGNGSKYDIAGAALSLTGQAASAHPTAVPAQTEQTSVQTSYRSAWVDHTRKAEPGDYTS